MIRYDGVCRSKRCVLCQTACRGAAVYSSDTAERRNRVAARRRAAKTASVAQREHHGFRRAERARRPAYFGVDGALFAGATSEHACARLGDRLFCWGAHVFGEVGDETTRRSCEPGAKLRREERARQTCHEYSRSGRWRAPPVRSRPRACWGANHRQQLGNGAVTPQRVPLRSF